MDHRHRQLVLLSIVSFACFAVAVLLVATGTGTDRVDDAVSAAAGRHANGTLLDAADLLADVVSPTVDAILLGLVAVWLTVRRDSWVPLVSAAATGWLVAVSIVVLKQLVGRPAPFSDDPRGTSFPSGHTGMAIVCFGVVALLTTRPGTMARTASLFATACLTVLVAAGLVYANYHWLSDTVASMLLGTGALALLDLWLRRRRASRSPRAGTPTTARTAPRR